MLFIEMGRTGGAGLGGESSWFVQVGYEIPVDTQVEKSGGQLRNH